MRGWSLGVGSDSEKVDPAVRKARLANLIAHRPSGQEVGVQVLVRDLGDHLLERDGTMRLEQKLAPTSLDVEFVSLAKPRSVERLLGETDR